jgi:hypothetical protein
MKITPVAFDSFGVKSSCIRVETPDAAITIDPGIAAETNSFPLPAAERLALVGRFGGKIRAACGASNIIVVTHYHYDHFIDSGDKQLYGGKTLLVKHPEKRINASQRRRAASWLPKAKKIAKEIHFADGKEFHFGKTRIRFSKPLWHGLRGTSLGYVLMATVDDGKEKLVYSSDIDGPYIEQQADLIIKEKPTYLILDGPVLYLLGFILSYKNLLKIIKNLIKIIKNIKPKYVILDHHALRDYRYRELLTPVFEQAKRSGVKILTAAELLGKEPKVLEGYRKNGPTRWKEWERLSIRQLEKTVEKISSKGRGK